MSVIQRDMIALSRQEKAARFHRMVVANLDKRAKQGMADFERIAIAACREAAAYIALGDCDYPCAIVEAVLHDLETVAINLSNASSIKEKVADLRLISKIARDGLFGFKSFPWEVIGQIPHMIWGPLGALLSSVVEDEQYMHGDITAPESPYWLGKYYIPPDPGHITTRRAFSGVYICDVTNGIRELRLPSQVADKSRRVMESYEEVRKLLPPHSFQSDLSRRIISCEVVGLKEEIEIELAHIVVGHIVEPYLAGKLL